MITAIVTLICAVLILGRALYVVNKMDHKTNHVMRIAFVILCFGEFAIIAGFLFGLPTASHFEIMVINLAVLGFAWLDKRRIPFEDIPDKVSSS